MPTLDRRITVRRTVESRNQYGEVVETATDYPSWATREDTSQIDAETQGGSLSTATRSYVIRFRAEINAALVSELKVIEGNQTLNVTNILEADPDKERRRFLRLEAVGEVV